MAHHYLDPKQLETFAEVARTGSFTRSAKKLFLTQSAVSHSIRSLEEELECKLFDRSGKKVVLTHAGKHLFQHLPPVFQALEGARRAVEELRSWGRGRIRIGASSTVCQHILTQVLREFKECFPEVGISLHGADTPACREALVAKEIDLGLTIGGPAVAALHFEEIYEDELRLVLSPHHPLAKPKGSSVREAAKATLFSYQSQSETSTLIQNALLAKKWQFREVLELGNMEAIKDFVRMGLGVGILPSWIVHKEIEIGSLVALPPRILSISRKWGVATLKGKKLSLIEGTLKGLCKGTFAQLPQWEDLEAAENYNRLVAS